MKNMTVANKSRIQGIILFVLGVIMMVIYKIGNIDIKDPFLLNGLGIGFIAGGIGAFIGASFKPKGYEKNIMIQENDERLHTIWDKAGHASYNLNFMAVIILFIIASISDLSAPVICIILLILMPVSHIAFTYYYNKRI